MPKTVEKPKRKSSTLLEFPNLLSGIKTFTWLKDSSPKSILSADQNS